MNEMASMEIYLTTFRQHCPAVTVFAVIHHTTETALPSDNSDNPKVGNNNYPLYEARKISYGHQLHLTPTAVIWKKYEWNAIQSNQAHIPLGDSVYHSKDIVLTYWAT